MITGHHESAALTLHPAAIIGIGICPALAGATGFREGAILGAGMVAIQLLTIAVLTPVRSMILPRCAPLITVAVAGGFTAILVMVGQAYIPDLLVPLVLYAYLTPVGLPVLCTARWLRQGDGEGITVRACMVSAAGAAILLAVISMLREIFGTGKCFGRQFFIVPPFPWVTKISGGILVAAFILSIAAAVSMFRKRSRRGGSQ